MKVIIGCIIFVVFVLFMGRTEISFNPFFIRMPGWQNVVGCLLLLIGIGFLCNDARQRGYDEGLQDVYEVLEKYKKDLENEEERML